MNPMKGNGLAVTDMEAFNASSAEAALKAIPDLVDRYVDGTAPIHKNVMVGNVLALKNLLKLDRNPLKLTEEDTPRNALDIALDLLHSNPQMDAIVSVLLKHVPQLLSVSTEFTPEHHLVSSEKWLAIRIPYIYAHVSDESFKTFLNAFDSLSSEERASIACHIDPQGNTSMHSVCSWPLSPSRLQALHSRGFKILSPLNNNGLAPIHILAQSHVWQRLWKEEELCREMKAPINPETCCLGFFRVALQLAVAELNGEHGCEGECKGLLDVLEVSTGDPKQQQEKKTLGQPATNKLRDSFVLCGGMNVVQMACAYNNIALLCLLISQFKQTEVTEDTASSLLQTSFRYEMDFQPDISVAKEVVKRFEAPIIKGKQTKENVSYGRLYKLLFEDRSSNGNSSLVWALRSSVSNTTFHYLSDLNVISHTKLGVYNHNTFFYDDTFYGGYECMGLLVGLIEGKEDFCKLVSLKNQEGETFVTLSNKLRITKAPFKMNNNFYRLQMPYYTVLNRMECLDTDAGRNGKLVQELVNEVKLEEDKSNFKAANEGYLMFLYFALPMIFFCYTMMRDILDLHFSVSSTVIYAVSFLGMMLVLTSLFVLHPPKQMSRKTTLYSKNKTGPLHTPPFLLLCNAMCPICNVSHPPRSSHSVIPIQSYHYNSKLKFLIAYRFTTACYDRRDTPLVTVKKDLGKMGVFQTIATLFVLCLVTVVLALYNLDLPTMSSIRLVMVDWHSETTPIQDIMKQTFSLWNLATVALTIANLAPFFELYTILRVVFSNLLETERQKPDRWSFFRRLVQKDSKDTRRSQSDVEQSVVFRNPFSKCEVRNFIDFFSSLCRDGVDWVVPRGTDESHGFVDKTLFFPSGSKGARTDKKMKEKRD